MSQASGLSDNDPALLAGDSLQVLGRNPLDLGPVGRLTVAGIARNHAILAQEVQVALRTASSTA